MYQVPVNNLTRIRKARKQVKRSLEDIGLEFCKEAAEQFKEFSPDEDFVQDTFGLDIATWDPSHSKTQVYRSKPFCCTECPFSSKYYSGYKNHFRNVHRQLFESKILLNCPYCSFSASKRILETHVKIFHIPTTAPQTYPSQQPALQAKKTNIASAAQRPAAEKPVYFCKKCTFRDTLYNVVRRHIYREHFQHVVSPYLGMVSDTSLRNGVNSLNGNTIFCKRCQFSTRNYEALVQHVIEYHERIGAQVTNMIAHVNVAMSRPQPQPQPAQPQKVSPASNRQRAAVSEQGIGHLKPIAPRAKNQSIKAAGQVPARGGAGNAAAENSGVNTAQTQKWKICTVCNELFPENLYSAHFESAHKAKKVWALAKYIMKIHNYTSKCLLCNRYLPSDTLLNHMLIHGLTCPQCHSAFHSVEKLMEHVAQTHPNDFFGPPGSSPLTFDLTIKQGKTSNVQLAVITFNMKDPVNGQDQASFGQKNVSIRPKLSQPKMIVKHNEPKGFVSLINNTDVGKTVCPLCFTILKGPISDALALHLRERHQVLQTMHPVEKKMTYKCIHCLGVYTSNMVASTITLHLVQCRAVGRSQGTPVFKPTLAVNTPGIGLLKRPPPPLISINPKKLKLDKGSKMTLGGFGGKVEPVNLLLNPQGYEHKTYEERKNFLTAYFNRRPYPSSQEEEKLSASLWLWKSDVGSHFKSKQRMCIRHCQTKKISVLLGFNMHALKTVKHNIDFPEEAYVGLSSLESADSKSSKSSRQAETPKPSAVTETICIDSDTDPEMGNTPTKKKTLLSGEPINLTEDTSPVKSIINLIEETSDGDETSRVNKKISPTVVKTVVINETACGPDDDETSSVATENSSHIDTEDTSYLDLEEMPNMDTDKMSNKGKDPSTQTDKLEPPDAKETATVSAGESKCTDSENTTNMAATETLDVNSEETVCTDEAGAGGTGSAGSEDEVAYVEEETSLLKAAEAEFGEAEETPQLAASEMLSMEITYEDEPSNVDSDVTRFMNTSGTAYVEASETPLLDSGEIYMNAGETAHLDGGETANLDASESAHLEAEETSHLEAEDTSQLEAEEISQLEAEDMAHLEAAETAQLDAVEMAHEDAGETAHLEAGETAHVDAGEMPHPDGGETSLLAADELAFGEPSETVEMEFVNEAEASTEESSLQDGTENACVAFC